VKWDRILRRRERKGGERDHNAHRDENKTKKKNVRVQSLGYLEDTSTEFSTYLNILILKIFFKKIYFFNLFLRLFCYTEVLYLKKS